MIGIEFGVQGIFFTIQKFVWLYYFFSRKGGICFVSDASFYWNDDH
jgi:hypothetical protein